MKNYTLLSAAICVLLGLWCKTPSHAQVIAADSFDYQPNRVSASCNGGTGWSGPWLGNVIVSQTGLTHTGLVVQGNKLQTLGQNGSGFRKLANARNTIKKRTWMSFLINIPSGLFRHSYGGISLFNNNREEFFIGLNDLSDSYGFAPCLGGLVQYHSTTTLAINTHLLVCLLDGHDSTTDLYLWIDPNLSTEPLLTNSAASLVNIRPNFTFDRIRIASGGDLKVDVDELRISSSCKDAIRATNEAQNKILEDQKVVNVHNMQDVSTISIEDKNAFVDAIKEASYQKIKRMLDASPALIDIRCDGTTINPEDDLVVAKSFSNLSPLHHAMRLKGELGNEIIKLLLTKTPDINALANHTYVSNGKLLVSKITPLFFASTSRDRMILLLRNGADPNIESSEHQIIRRWIADVDMFRLMKLLRMDFNVADEDGDTTIMKILNSALHFSGRPTEPNSSYTHDSLMEIYKLISYGATLATENKTSDTPSHLLAQFDMTSPHPNHFGEARRYTPRELNDVMHLSRLVVTNTPDVNILDGKRLPPLRYALGSGSLPGLVALLIAKGADVNFQDASQLSNLHFAVDQAVFSKDLSKVQMLLDHGAKVNILDANGNTPLQHALKANNGEAVAELLRRYGGTL